MKYRKLGNTDIDVSVICLGTMTWGEQNSPAQAFEQMDYAVSQGVTFFDTAELYAIPPKAETYGRTEENIASRLYLPARSPDLVKTGYRTFAMEGHGLTRLILARV